MFHYSPPSRSHGYTSYLPRRSYFPGSFDIYEEPSLAHPLEDLGYPSLSHSFLPPQVDAETRYRRALYELQAAEQEYQSHISLERARLASAIRERAAAEAAQREREHEIAFFAEIERINHARALQEQVEERLAQRQRGLRSQVAFDRAHYRRHAPLRAFYSDAESDSVPQGHCARLQPDNGTLTIGDLLGVSAGVGSECVRSNPPQRPTPCGRRQPETDISTIGDLLGLFSGAQHERQGACPRQRPTPSSRRQPDTDTSGVGNLLGLFGGVHPEAHRPQRPTSPTSSQPHQPTEPHTQSQAPERENVEANLSNILEFFHNIAAQARAAAGGEQSSHGVRLSV